MVHIDFEDRGGLMGFEILPIEDGDESKYEVITITSPIRWKPQQFLNEKVQDAYFYDPSNHNLDHTTQGEYPATVNHASQMIQLEQLPVSLEIFNPVDSIKPM